MTNKDTKGRRLRWALILQGHRFDISHIDGKENYIAEQDVVTFVHNNFPNSLPDGYFIQS